MPGCDITRIFAKQEGLEIPYQDLFSPENYTDSTAVTGHLVTAILGWKHFRSEEQSHIKKVRRSKIKCHYNNSTTCELKKATCNLM